MKYTVIYKKFSEMGGKFVLVEDTIEADRFGVVDGCLVFYRENDGARTIPLMAIPPTMWAHVEPVVESSPLVT